MRKLLFLLLMSALPAAHAETVPAKKTVPDSAVVISPAAEKKVAGEKPAGKNPTGENKKKKQLEVQTPDTFNPTEKLSEDIAVDFPVDI